MNNSIKGIDFPISATQLLNTEEYKQFVKQSDSEIFTCLDVEPLFAYNDAGVKIGQKGYKYNVYISSRKLTLSVSVEDMNCAIDLSSDETSKVRFTNFRGTFYVDKRNRLQMSCKADAVEVVSYDKETF